MSNFLFLNTTSGCSRSSSSSIRLGRSGRSRTKAAAGSQIGQQPSRALGEVALQHVPHHSAAKCASPELLRPGKLQSKEMAQAAGDQTPEPHVCDGTVGGWHFRHSPSSRYRDGWAVWVDRFLAGTASLMRVKCRRKLPTLPWPLQRPRLQSSLVQPRATALCVALF